MDVEVVTPSAYVGDCIGDLSRRRGEIRAQHSRGSIVTIEAHVPLKEMFGYIGTLRALSSGRAQYTMQFDHYALAPPAIAQALTAAQDAENREWRNSDVPPWHVTSSMSELVAERVDRL